mgnify:CR=1 FL=1
MKPREEPNFFDSFEDYKHKRDNNRQIAYENKVCRKIVMRMFEKGSSERNYWIEQLEASSEPLAAIQDLLGTFCLTTHRLQQWSINDLLGPPASMSKLTLWKEFAEKVAQCASENPKGVPAMAFYNSVIGQDMVIHTGMTTCMPNGYFRLVRSSTSGDGGVIIDTLDGFLEIISGA